MNGIAAVSKLGLEPMLKKEWVSITSRGIAVCKIYAGKEKKELNMIL